MRTPPEWANAPPVVPRSQAQRLKGTGDLIMVQSHMGIRLGDLRHVQGLMGSQRPCRIPTCGGTIRANLQLYTNGKHKVTWHCDRCHIEMEFGSAEARTAEAALEGAL